MYPGLTPLVDVEMFSDASGSLGSVPCSALTNCMVRGRLVCNRLQSSTRNYSLSLLQLMCGAVRDSGGLSCSTRTMNQ